MLFYKWVWTVNPTLLIFAKQIKIFKTTEGYCNNMGYGQLKNTVSEALF
jgi:hypothetical protein